ncbi:MAG: carbon monoxide dehydrogenase subunit G [Chloroflexi bacterium]|nr:carbon monoxide dehydrogenase subunit G [Chloroflexota bacterium]
MKIQGSFTFAATPEALWPLLFDAQVLRRIVPGSQSVASVGEDEFSGNLVVRVGPLAGAYEGIFHLTDVQPQSGYAFTFAAHNDKSTLAGNGRLHLQPHNNHTVLHYEAQTEVGGDLQQHAAPLLETSARAIVRQSLERLDQLIQTGQITDIPPVHLLSPPHSARPSLSSAAYGRIALLLALLTLAAWILLRRRRATAHE